MGTQCPQDPGSALSVSEEHEILAKEPDERGFVLQIGRKTNRPPVTAKQLSHGSTRIHPREDFILFFGGRSK
jgi:hypothetical protein